VTVLGNGAETLALALVLAVSALRVVVDRAPVALTLMVAEPVSAVTVTGSREPVALA
jgi:hypothetical protein